MTLPACPQQHTLYTCTAIVCVHASAGALLNQKALYLAAKQARQSEEMHVRNRRLQLPLGHPEELERSASSISSSNKCYASSSASQGSLCSSQQIASELHDQDKTPQKRCAMLPISGVASCASHTKDANSVMHRASGSDIASVAGGGQAKVKVSSKRAAAPDAVQKPHKVQATAETQAGRQKAAARKNLAELFEKEE
jgi:hypothetical protein